MGLINPAVAVAAIVRSNQNNILGQFILVGLQRWYVSLRPTWLPDNPAGVAFGQTRFLAGLAMLLP
jgi:hypothetical protein